MEETPKYKAEDFKDWAEDVIDNGIIPTLEALEPNKITILTGNNGTGKSLIRSLCWRSISDAVGKRVKVADISMQRRTGLHSEMGGAGVFLRDHDTTATSMNTLGFLKSILKADDRYIVLDEPEIGMSLEMQRSVAEYLNKVLPDVMTKNHGVLIITHSTEIISHLNADVFLNIQGMSKEEWLNREIKPIDLDEFDAKHSALYSALNERLKPVNE